LCVPLMTAIALFLFPAGGRASCRSARADLLRSSSGAEFFLPHISVRAFLAFAIAGRLDPAGTRLRRRSSAENYRFRRRI